MPPRADPSSLLLRANTGGADGGAPQPLRAGRRHQSPPPPPQTPATRPPRLPTSDLYAAVVVPGPPVAMLARTYVFCNSEAPRWEARFLLPLAHRAARLDFHVRDVNPLGSDLIGTASLPVAAVPRERAAAARTRRAHRPPRAELAGCRCLLAPPLRAKLASRRLPARAAAAPRGPAPPRVDLAGEAPSTFQISISNIPFFQF